MPQYRFLKHQETPFLFRQLDTSRRASGPEELPSTGGTMGPMWFQRLPTPRTRVIVEAFREREVQAGTALRTARPVLLAWQCHQTLGTEADVLIDIEHVLFVPVPERILHFTLPYRAPRTHALDQRYRGPRAPLALSRRSLQVQARAIVETAKFSSAPGNRNMIIPWSPRPV